MAVLNDNSPTGEQVKANILKAAIKIVRIEGWPALSMRKIAAHMKCSAPAIYSYFNNKNAIAVELAKFGFRELTTAVLKAKIPGRLPSEQLERMWDAYAKYARKERGLYKLMFGVFSFPDNSKLFEQGEMERQLKEVIRKSIEICTDINERVNAKYDMLWALSHGLASVNLNCNKRSAHLYHEILIERIRAINAI